MAKQPVYLDYQATTPLDPRVVCAMVEAFNLFGNPHGRQHAYGRAAADAIDSARSQVAGLVGAYPQRIVFTSGATESCNLALRGAARAAPPQRRRIVTLATEHAAVLETIGDLGRQGFEAIILPVARDGLVDLNRLEDAVDDKTLIVSIMAVNNEIGVIQPLGEVAAICHRYGALLHSDATQAPARIAVDVEVWGADLMSISSHKLYGPKGVGALYVADDVSLRPMSTGGGQERGLRPGTVPTTLVCGFGEAANLAAEEGPADAERMAELAAALRTGIDAMAVDVHQFGSLEARAPGTLSFGFHGIAGDKLVAIVETEIAISTGAACSSENAAVSHVLAALGCSHAEASTGVRVGLGRFTTEQDIKVALAAFNRATGVGTWRDRGQWERRRVSSQA